jgi:hypothetical protein
MKKPQAFTCFLGGWARPIRAGREHDLDLPARHCEQPYGRPAIEVLFGAYA